MISGRGGAGMPESCGVGTASSRSMAAGGFPFLEGGVSRRSIAECALRELVELPMASAKSGMVISRESDVILSAPLNLPSVLERKISGSSLRSPGWRVALDTAAENGDSTVTLNGAVLPPLFSRVSLSCAAVVTCTGWK